MQCTLLKSSVLGSVIAIEQLHLFPQCGVLNLVHERVSIACTCFLNIDLVRTYQCLDLLFANAMHIN